MNFRSSTPHHLRQSPSPEQLTASNSARNCYGKRPAQDIKRTLDSLRLLF